MVLDPKWDARQCTVGRLVSPPGEVRRSLAIARLLVAEGDPEWADKLEPRLSAARKSLDIQDDTADGFRDSMDAWGDETLETWLNPMLCWLCVSHPFIPFEDLLAGPLHRRVDSILDRFGTEFCAHEVQSHYMTLVGALVEAAEDPTSTTLKFIAGVGLGFAGGYATSAGFTPGISLAQRAAEWIDKQGLTPTQRALELAAVILVWSLLPTNRHGPAPATAELVSRVQTEHLGSQFDPVRARLLAATLGLMDASHHIGKAMPSLVGRSLKHATKVAERLGLDVVTVDAIQQGSEARDPWNPANWLVRAQLPLRGAPITKKTVVLAVSKRNERSRAELHRLLEVEFESVC